MKLKGADMKIIELTVTREMFGDLLILCYEQNIDLKYAMTFPILPIPLMLGRVDGSMNSTEKATLVHHLEKFIRELQYEYQPDIVLIDFMFLLRCLATFQPKIYREVARYILRAVCAFNADTIIMVCDIYLEEPTIKDMCHGSRGDIDDILGNNPIGSGQSRPKNMNTALLSSKYKRMLLSFLIEEWKTCGDIIGAKKVSFSYDKCYTYLVRYNKLGILIIKVCILLEYI